MKCKILTAILSMALIFGVFGGVTASARMQYISYFSASCSLNNQTGIVTISACIDGYQNITTNVAIEMQIQYYNNTTGKWVTVDTVYEWFNNWTGDLVENWLVSPGFSYRGRVFFDAYYYTLCEFTMLDTKSVAY